MTERLLFSLQRVSAMALAPFVVLHLGLIVYAVRDGLTAGEILGRTQGSLGWALFYGLFVLAVAVHAPIGLRNIAREWLGLGDGAANGLAGLFAAVLLALGLRALAAVIW